MLKIIGNEYNKCNVIKGSYKSDIKSENNILKAQIKKFKKGQFQQLDRHWISDFINYIPELNCISPILKNLFEYELLPNKTHINKDKSLKKLCNSNYSNKELKNFLDLLNKFKRKILEYAFLGMKNEMKPIYLIGVEYIKEKRNKIVAFKIENIINYLLSLDFQISPKKSAIYLGKEGTISIQRKGGDKGKKSSNQIQFKIKLSKLIDNVDNSQYVY